MSGKSDEKIWTMEEQFAPDTPRHRVSERYKARQIDATTKKRVKRPKELGLNAFGAPEAMLLYGKDRTVELEFACDLTVTRLVEDGHDMLVCAGLQLLCPKCKSPINIRGHGIPGGRPIHVHWDQMRRSNVDGLWRPSATVEGTFGCDYYESEIVGQKQSRASKVSMPCGWRGGIDRGRIFDHSISVVKG